jgi:hypothetical protein
MISIHRIEDFALTGHGHMRDDHWFELEIITAEGIQNVTLYCHVNSNAYKRIVELQDLLVTAAVVEKDNAE